jgi:hypothetical protein
MTFDRTEQRSARPLLGSIHAVTYTVPELDLIERAYVNQLDYRVVAKSRIGATEARAWGTPLAAGLPSLLLAPASGEAVYLRFIEDASSAGWKALETFGWNATEFVVENVDELAMRLAGGAFDIIGPPKALTRFPMIKAMQAIGPAGECCYFTQVGPGSGLQLAAARSFVGRVFIVVAAAANVESLFAPYTAFANAVDPPVATPVIVISRAHGLPLDTLHRHGLIRLPAGTLIELDQYPASAHPRRRIEGRLPPGMAIVTFGVDSLDDQPLIAPPAPCALPSTGGLAGCLRGAAGELIEMVTNGPV